MKKSKAKITYNSSDIKSFLISTHAITLISLVITIVILIILSGITINLSLGPNGLFTKFKETKEQYIEAVAREKLELVLLNANTEKQLNKNYNAEDFLNNMLKEKDIIVNENFVIVDNYTFKIDRQNLKIIENLGETSIKISKEIKKYNGKNNNNKYEVDILLKIEATSPLKNVLIKKTDGTIYEMTTEELISGKIIALELDEEYDIIVTTNDGKTETRKIQEKSEETIYTAKELADFRDKVNTGLSYEGKIIKLGNNIDLSSVCGRNINGQEISWEPIGLNPFPYEEEKYFGGTFDGNYHVINNLYINIQEPNNSGCHSIAIGLFCGNYGTIQNLIMEHSYIYYNSDIINSSTEWQFVGVVTGFNTGTIKNCGVNSGELRGLFSSQSTKVSGFYIGGVVGCSSGNIDSCYNKSTIYGEAYNNSSKFFIIGGISGDTEWGGQTNNCYNVGEIIVNKNGTNKVLCGGVLGSLDQNSALLKNSYNINNITVLEGLNISFIGGLAGQTINTGKIQNSYCTDNFSVSYYNSTTKKTDGIVNSQTLKNSVSILNEDSEIWINDIGINDGYPILKWQVEKK